MKSLIYNLGYFLKETVKIIRLNLLSNFVSLIGTVLILFLLGMVLTGGSIGNRLVTILSEEAEINAYFSPDLTEAEVSSLVSQVNNLQGVREARLISKAEAEEDMKKTLGDEAEILTLFDDNPFEAYIEVRIHIEAMDDMSGKLEAIKGIDYIRNNRAVLEQIEGITNALKLLGLLVFIAVGITTIIILSHMIRQGIYNNREQIQTLRLLGAPNAFISFPYILVGLLLTLIGGIIAAILLVYLINGAYGQLSGAIPFLPLPPKQELISQMTLMIPAISLALGLVGSLFGLSSIRDGEK